MIRVGDQIPIWLQLFDGVTTKFPRAVVRNAAGTAISGSPFDLTHVADGLYSNSAAVMPSTPFVSIQYLVFNEVGRTTMDNNYSVEVEIEELDTSAPLTTALDNTVWTGAKAAFIDVAISSRAAAATAVSNVDYTSSRATKIDFLDVAVSSRLATAGYTAPDNADIVLIKAKTDNLPADPASNTQVNTRAPASTALDNTVWTNAKAAFLDVAISSVAGSVWEQLLASHNTAGTFGANAQNPPLSPSAVASAVWDALTASYTVSGSFGLALQSPSLTPTQIANAVWDALTSAHTVSGSFGLNAQTPSLNPSQVASAVWDALLASYVVSGSFGQKINSLSNGGGGGSVLEAAVEQLVLIQGEVEQAGIAGEAIASASISTEILEVEIDAQV